MGAVLAITAGLAGPAMNASATDTYNIANSAVTIKPCAPGTTLTQSDTILDIGGNRRTLVTSWMPASVAANNTQRIRDLVTWADRSTVSTSPLTSGAQGLISQGNAAGANYKDYVLVTQNLLLWFDFTPDHPLAYGAEGSLITPNGGGGQLRGVWPIHFNGLLLNFKNIANGMNWAPNAFLPGSNGSGLSGSGLSGLISMSQADDGNTFSVENDTAASLSHHLPLMNVDNEPNSPLRNDGFLVQAVGKFVDSKQGGDRYSVGSGTTTGHLGSVTTYRVAACDTKVFVETSWKSQSLNRIGPLSNILNATNFNGNQVGGLSAGNAATFTGTTSATCVSGFGPALDDNKLTCSVNPPELLAKTDAGTRGARSRPSFSSPPPTITLSTRTSAGETVTPSASVRPLSGAISQAVVFNKHSMADTLIPAHDITYFNRSFWVDADHRLTAPSGTLPRGMTRTGDSFFISPGQTITTRFVMEFK